MENAKNSLNIQFHYSIQENDELSFYSLAPIFVMTMAAVKFFGLPAEKLGVISYAGDTPEEDSLYRELYDASEDSTPVELVTDELLNSLFERGIEFYEVIKDGKSYLVCDWQYDKDVYFVIE